MPESIKSFKFGSHDVNVRRTRTRMSGEFDSRKDSLSIKFEQRPRMFVAEPIQKVVFNETFIAKNTHPYSDLAIKLFVI